MVETPHQKRRVDLWHFAVAFSSAKRTTVRFYMEVASDAKYNVHFVFPLGIAWSI